MAKYIKTQYPGVRYREHKDRKHNGKLDRYFFIRYKNAGRSIEESVGWASNGMNAQKANKIRAELVQNIKEGKRPQTLNEKREMIQELKEKEVLRQKQKAAEQITFSDLGERYISWAKSSKKSWRDDEQRYNSHLKPFLGDIRLNEISSFSLERLKSDLQKKQVSQRNKSSKKKTLSPATVKHCLVLVRQIFNKAMSWGMYQGPNPIKKVKLPSVKNNRLRFLSYEEADQLLNELKKVSTKVHDQALVSLHCGLRFGEIAKLTLADLDFSHEVIQIRDPKGDGRQAYMTSEVKEILLERKPAKPTDYIFPTLNGKTQQTVSKTFDRVVGKLGFNSGITDRRDKVVFHSLRHTFGSWLAIQGTPILTIKELLGHKSIEMTMRYAHLIPDQKREAVGNLAKAFDIVRNNQKTHLF